MVSVGCYHQWGTAGQCVKCGYSPQRFFTNYISLPPKRTVSAKARFTVRGRGKPKPYPLEV